MSQTWSEYQTVPAGSEEPPAGIERGKYVIAIENGHGALTAWAAGPARCFRSEFPIDARPPVETVCTDPRTGEETVRRDPFSEDDANAIAAAINAYIEGAGVPPMPQGFLWHILVPDSIEDGSALDRSLAGKNMQLRPAVVLATIRDAYGQLLSDL